MSKKKKKRGLLISVLCGLLIPFLEVLIIVGCNSSWLIRKNVLIILICFLAFTIIMLMYGLKIFFDNFKSSNVRLKKWLKGFYYFCMIVYVLGCSAFMFIMYGPINYFRNLYITTAMKTMHHKYLAQIFYSDETIQDIMNSNYFIELNENADVDSIKINTAEKKEYLDDYERELLTRDGDNDLYKILDITIGNSNAYLVAIYDPTKVRLIRTKKFNIGGSGERVVTMCERYKGAVCINAGGFVDYGMGSDIPTGYVIENGEIIWSDGDATSSRQNIIGLTFDGKLKLMSNATGEEALDDGVMDGIVFGPFLIVNGKPLNIVGDPWGKAPRVAIAQRKDGVMMFLVVDGENYINGASLKEMVDVLLQYGAYNAANLDGGQSTSLVVENSLYNNPPAAAKSQKGRYVVTGFGLIP